MKKYFPWVLFIAVSIGLMVMMMENKGQKVNNEITFSDFIAQVDRNNIHNVIISGSQVSGHFKDSNRVFTTTIAGVSSLLPRLEEHKIGVEIKSEEEASFWTNLALNSFPIQIGRAHV